MTDIIWKLRILPRFIFSAVHDWKESIWKRDINRYECCSGHECGCGGQTIKDMWEGVYGD